MRIAVDAMGGDHAPQNPVNGAILAARELGVEVVLVGDEQIVGPVLREHGAPAGVVLVHAEQSIAMDESAAVAVRRKRQSSIHVAARLVRQGEVRGLVSAGNTGAVMAVAKVIIGTIPGVDRPALAVILPTRAGHAVVLDVGANVEPKSHHLVQFAVLGDEFARQLLGAEPPRVGLLSIGEEAVKGNELVRAAHAVLVGSSLAFVGNVEARDLFRGKADVVVCDGFTGNILLKTGESAVEMLGHMLREEFTRTIAGRIGALLARGAFRRVRARADYAEFGGAPLLGLRGLAVICHGRSSPRAMRNGIRVAMEYSEHGVNERVEAALARLDDRREPEVPSWSGPAQGADAT